MSVSYQSQNTYPMVKNFTAVQTWTQVILPSKGRIITIGAEHDIYVSFEGTDGGTTTGINKLFIKAGGYMALNRGVGNNQHNSVYVATKASSSAEITLILEE